MNDTLKNALISFFQNKKKLFLFFSIISGIIILYPQLDFQYFIAQGDHGRELYGYKKVLEGSIPYRDFSWPFGPLLTLYYGAFYIIFGVKIQSILFGHVIFIVLVGILTYLICSEFMMPSLAFIAALWYWVLRGEEFYYSYHHIGGLFILLTILFCCFRYIKTSKIEYVYASFLGLLLLMLTRFNMGLAMLVALVCSLSCIEYIKKEYSFPRVKKEYLILSFITLSIAGLIYWLILHPMPFYVIYQTFPYGNAQRGDAPIDLLDSALTAGKMIYVKFFGRTTIKIFGISAVCSLVYGIYLLLRNKLPQKTKTQIALIFVPLSIFCFFALHEFLISGKTTPFRFLWASPILNIIVFYLISYLFVLGSSRFFTPFVKKLLLFIFFICILFNLSTYWRVIHAFKTPAHMLQVQDNKVYTVQHTRWFQTVSQTVDYIDQNIPKDDMIFAIPHDSLLYFLSNRDAGSRQLDFFKHNFIPEEQEKATIAELEKNKVNWIIMSNRVHSVEKGMGIFGETHCLLLTEYIIQNFERRAAFGEMNHPKPGWAWNYGTKILKRKNPI